MTKIKKVIQIFLIIALTCFLVFFIEFFFFEFFIPCLMPCQSGKADLEEVTIVELSIISSEISKFKSSGNLPMGADSGAGNSKIDDSGNSRLFKRLSQRIMPHMGRYKPSKINPKYDVYLDVWGNPYIYKCPGKINPSSYDLYSIGPNGIDDNREGDDIFAGKVLYKSLFGSIVCALLTVSLIVSLLLIRKKRRKG